MRAYRGEAAQSFGQVSTTHMDPDRSNVKGCSFASKAIAEAYVVTLTLKIARISWLESRSGRRDVLKLRKERTFRYGAKGTIWYSPELAPVISS